MGRFIYSITISFLFLTTIHAGSISVMSYNVENLFDTEDDPRISDDEFTPGRRADWTEEKLQVKLNHLSSVLLAVKNADGSVCPDVLGLVEVENREVLEYWRTNFLSACGYKHIVINRHTPDEPIQDDQRGIKVALMTKLSLGGQPSMYLPAVGGRYILEVPLKLDNKLLVVFVNHWKSRIGDGESKRIEAGKILRARFEEWNQHDPYADLIAMGDFNDEPENKSFTTGLGVIEDASYWDHDLSHAFIWNTSFEEFNLAQKLREAKDQIALGEPLKLSDVEKFWRQKRGSYYYHREKKFNQLDHLLVSRGLLDQNGFTYQSKSFKVIRPVGYTDEIGAPIPFSPSQDGYVGGASDHFPIIIRLSY